MDQNMCHTPIPRGIQLIPTQELIEELFARYDTGLFVAHRKDTNDHGHLAWNTKGNKYTMLGLSEHMGELVRGQVFDTEAGMEE